MGEAELFLGVLGGNANTFRETGKLFAGRRGDQCIIFRDEGSTDGGLTLYADVVECPGEYSGTFYMSRDM